MMPVTIISITTIVDIWHQWQTPERMMVHTLPAN